MKIKYLIISSTILFCLATNANSALLTRLGGLAYYDTELDVTWLANANLVLNNPLNTNLYTYTQPDGRTKQWFASYMIDELNEGMYLGIDNWRLPTTGPINGVSYDFSSSSTPGVSDWGDDLSAPGTPYAGSTINEMAYLFYNSLGDTSDGGIGRFDAGPFNNLETYAYYLTGTTVMQKGALQDLVFTFDGGAQFFMPNNASYQQGFVWAVRDGDITVVPLPSSAWFLFSGSIGLLTFFRRKRNA